ncbi:hypothetical protein PHYBLDRAFT_166465 [Phycomyces blakesleeanus NRRL 1555(-)]|uniref:Uncharacterized protein n=1 Tax=Phycomyces blakesleeanus (strain ATCC 8743b / DSM 1359 / FGSC 10004 / NBRC 33097 / NRRL 1555) TaxID=763407 RepID=A0A162NL19_PHYB8|nr:hypothetical protein PHYBLDRAFT_166465 [Phycomyces blakesleeanus NRRL 1555(-)]OAD75198.1 hypothetical protein PHYBLDRAFT_166465 [Phycomyces blakesleeanus NRRL 1555(-)]|eukprot:XP_018293238.1 hypothetical protein PHYBLDRAFT_166465 [Phycomyces blakesleeanus NRRL 1555(-)]
MRHKVVFQDDGGHLLLEYYFLQPAFCQAQYQICVSLFGYTLSDISRRIISNICIPAIKLNTKYVSLCLAILCLIYQVMSNIMHEDNVSLFKDYWYCLDNSEEHVYIKFMSSLLRLQARSISDYNSYSIKTVAKLGFLARKDFPIK